MEGSGLESERAGTAALPSDPSCSTPTLLTRGQPWTAVGRYCPHSVTAPDGAGWDTRLAEGRPLFPVDDVWGPLQVGHPGRKSRFVTLFCVLCSGPPSVVTGPQETAGV